MNPLYFTSIHVITVCTLAFVLAHLWTKRWLIVFSAVSIGTAMSFVWSMCSWRLGVAGRDFLYDPVFRLTLVRHHDGESVGGFVLNWVLPTVLAYVCTRLLPTECRATTQFTIRSWLIVTAGCAAVLALIAWEMKAS